MSMALISSLYLFTKAVVLFPFTHVVSPIIRLCWLIFKHLVIVPFVLMFRTFLFAFVYVPLTPVLRTARVEYNPDVPVEQWLFGLAMALKPHISQFVVHFVHYTMVSLIMGSAVGVVAGCNIGLVSRLFTIAPEQPKRTRFTQTTPYVDRLANKPSVKQDTLPEEHNHPNRTMSGNLEILVAKIASESNKDVKVKQEKLNDSLAKIETESAKKPLESEPSSLNHASEPKFKDFPKPSPLAGLKNIGNDPLDALSRQLYEDDDGYGLMDYEDLENIDPQPPVVRPSQERRKRERKASESKYGAGTRKGSLVDIIIEEEAEKDASPIPRSTPMNISLSTLQLDLEGLPTLAPTDTNVSGESSFTREDELSSVVTAHSEDHKEIQRK